MLAKLDQERPHMKGGSLKIFFATNRLQRRWGERVTDEGTKTVQANDLKLHGIDDAAKSMLMLKTGLNFE